MIVTYDTPFEISRDFEPKGDQATAIEELLEGLDAGYRFQTLLGATGTGKTSPWPASSPARSDRPASLLMLLLVHDQELTRKFKIRRGSRRVLDVNQELSENGEQVGVRGVPDGHQQEAGGTTHMQAADDEVAVFGDEDRAR